VPRKTAENTVKHRGGGVGSVVANHRGGGEISMVVTTLAYIYVMKCMVYSMLVPVLTYMYLSMCVVVMAV